MPDDDSQPPHSRPSRIDWAVCALLLLPGITSAIGFAVTWQDYGIGGIIGLVIVAPLASLIATGLLTRDRQRLGVPMSMSSSVLYFVGFMIASLSLSFGCCAAVAEIR